ncbi:MAG TPA: SIR2 family protein, partial [Thermoanaerobaculia bacterium]|nr:SIR2 family protein [Thermoanaerobaculia bacterium]
YEREFKEEPSYSRILGRIAQHRDERQRLLKAYFEPTEEERLEGLKQPTAAHRAIASLCRRGYIRVIVTTNFDRLLALALSSEGLQPTVISTPDAVKGAPPLVHAALVIVKIHGDYLDTRIRNTTGELEAYPAPLTKLLDRIFDEFGLLVCGWSARWDPALRRALERCKNQRYTTYWTGLDEPDAELKDLLRLRRAPFIQIDGADNFFVDLNEKITALEEHARPHPLSVEAAVATLKRYLPDPAQNIRYRDLLVGEAERVRRESLSSSFAVEDPIDEVSLAARIQAYEAVTEILSSLFAVASFWGEKYHEPLLSEVVEQLAAHESRGFLTATSRHSVASSTSGD